MSSSAMTDPRPPYFAMRVLRLATKTALAQHCGTDVLALLCVVAVTEDARRYRGPVAFFNAQLLQLLGFRKWERLNRARRAAVEAGWLLYQNLGSRRAGLYRSNIPTEFESLADSPVDEESPLGSYPAKGDDRNSSSPPSSSGSSPENGYVEGHEQGEPSLPIPIPNPSPSNDDGDEWRKIQKQLREEGVRAWRESVRLARESECSPADIQAVIDYFRSRREAWESPSAALHHRVSNATPDQRPDDPATWLPFKPSFVSREQSAKEAQRRAATDEQRRLEDEQRVLERQRNADELQRLEDVFGAECDRLTADDMRQMATQDSRLAFALRLPPGNVQSPMVRRLLLNFLAQRKPFDDRTFTNSASGEGSSMSMPDDSAA